MGKSQNRQSSLDKDHITKIIRHQGGLSGDKYQELKKTLLKNRTKEQIFAIIEEEFIIEEFLKF